MASLLQGESVASWVARETPEGVEEQMAAARRSLGGRAGGALSPAGLAAQQALEERHGSNAIGAGGHRLAGMGQPLELRGGCSSGQRGGQSLDDQARSSSLSSGRVRGPPPCCACPNFLSAAGCKAAATPGGGAGASNWASAAEPSVG